jgi:hypothetical protein
MSEQLNAMSSIVFLLQREYVRECKLEPALDENGEPKVAENGEPIEKAVHPNGHTFQTWLKFNRLVTETPQIIQPTTPKLELLK